MNYEDPANDHSSHEPPPKLPDDEDDGLSLPLPAGARGEDKHINSYPCVWTSLG